MRMSRRQWAQIAAAAAVSGCATSQETSMLIDSPKGDFQFLKGSGPYSSGAVASPGFEVVHVIFNPLAELRGAFEIIEKHLAAAGRPIQALCGMELRIPKALSVEAFNDFNQPYIERLKQWGTHVDGLNPVARTNVALEVNPVAEPSVYGFCYTAPSDFAGKTFVVAGAGELRSSALAAEEIVSRGDLSADGLKAKAERVLGIMAERVGGMNVAWSDVTQSNIYTVHNIYPLMEPAIMPSLHEGGRHGVRWHFARPPVLEIEFEMDLRGLRREITVSG
jgi:hypothetical protein